MSLDAASRSPDVYDPVKPTIMSSQINLVTTHFLIESVIESLPTDDTAMRVMNRCSPLRSPQKQSHMSIFDPPERLMSREAEIAT